MDLIAELTWRGLIRDIIPGTAEQLKKEPTTGYIGFDPTADSLHIGSLVPILLLIHLQRAGHRPIALVGGATGMIGDPSGKSEERTLLDEERLTKNVEGIRRQLSKFLDFSAQGPTAPALVNNYDWFRNISFIEFLRDVGKHITVNYMMAKDSVRKRIEGDTGISYTEFAYQLMQGYDFYWLHKHMGCKLQMGGSDQWGNITTGAELIRRKSGEEVFAFTCPLITRADGGKFGKTERGNVWLDPEKTRLNAADADVEQWIRIFTFLSREEIEEIVFSHRQAPENRSLQKALARELTVFVHGEEEYRKAVETTGKLFMNQTAPAESLSVEDLEQMEGVVRHVFPRSRIQEQVDLVSFLAESGICASKGEARKLVQQGGLSLNRRKVADPTLKLEPSALLHDRFLLVQKGKKHYYLVEAG
jgi:tyrosyl-tRNA synthetase